MTEQAASRDPDPARSVNNGADGEISLQSLQLCYVNLRSLLGASETDSGRANEGIIVAKGYKKSPLGEVIANQRFESIPPMHQLRDWMTLAASKPLCGKSIGQLQTLCGLMPVTQTKGWSLSEAFAHLTSRRQDRNLRPSLTECYLIKALCLAAHCEIVTGESDTWGMISEFEHASNQFEALHSGKTEGDIRIFGSSSRLLWAAICMQQVQSTPICTLANQLHEQWPSNRGQETLADYWFEDSFDLLSRRNFGKKKLRVVLRCLCTAAIFGRPQAPSEALAPYLALSMVNIKECDLRTIRERYGSEAVSTLEKVASRTKVTRERVRQIESKVVNSIRGIGLALPVKAWALGQAAKVWDDLSNQGSLIRSDRFSESGYLRDKPELAFGLLIADLSIADLLDLVGNRTDQGNWVHKDC